ncbi:hypothetical protein SPSIL_052550 [Sporomusa silvacetica DSM 10669]|uniref:Uncharacterized protein n=1 Tax=Sporomusa silvacetica DSM 10669 TaxID=1123289 RepID=A0ABZ3IUC3_9FIRM|nr:hypothetical protein SPSIL_20840 [Sporomusa silvacetica DSM 10669]
MLPRVLYEQFNADLGYLVSKSFPILDKTKLQKKDTEIYQRLCNIFWDRLGFLSMENYRYYNLTNSFIGDNLSKISQTQSIEIVLSKDNEYSYCYEVKVYTIQKRYTYP